MFIIMPSNIVNVVQCRPTSFNVVQCRSISSNIVQRHPTMSTDVNQWSLMSTDKWNIRNYKKEIDIILLC